jgi:hypothetical protein
MQVSEATRTKLVRVKGDLLREFPHLPEERIELLVGSVTADILERARFDDFVPLLIHRSAREQLVSTRPDAVDSQAS